MKALPILGILTGVAVVVWLLVPSVFIRGVLVGMFGAVGVALGLLGLVGRRIAKRAEKSGGHRFDPPPLPVDTWDYAMQLTDLSGRPFSFADSADRVIILNFWATWCAPCIAEMPSLRNLLSATADLDVRFGFVSREEAAAVRRFVEKQGLDLPIYLLTGDPPACFSTRSVPATFVIDRHGMIAMRHIGAAAWDAERVVTFVRGLAARPSTG